MSRQNPYPQKRQPAKRIALKKHETLMEMKDKEIERLTLRLGATLERLTVANSKTDAMWIEKQRERKIVNKIIGFEHE
jgi:hypothetical protein